MAKNQVKLIEILSKHDGKIVNNKLGKTNHTLVEFSSYTEAQRFRQDTERIGLKAYESFLGNNPIYKNYKYYIRVVW